MGNAFIPFKTLGQALNYLSTLKINTIADAKRKGATITYESNYGRA